jgi:hypothetical protein
MRTVRIRVAAQVCFGWLLLRRTGCLQARYLTTIMTVTTHGCGQSLWNHRLFVKDAIPKGAQTQCNNVVA